MLQRIRLSQLLLWVLLTLLIAACTARTESDPTEVSGSGSEQVTEDHGDNHGDMGQTMEGGHMEGGHMKGGHMKGGHMKGGHMEGVEHQVPAEAMAVANPVAATEVTLAAGAATYAQNCAVCHGSEGMGDGPGAAGLDPKPAQLGAEHVQMLSDGALFWIISHGIEGTAMPAWESILSESQRWEVVNLLRTFGAE